MAGKGNLLYPTQKYGSILEKYREVFDEVLGLKVIHFSFVRWTAHGDLLVLSNTVDLTELLLETKGYESSPFFTDGTLGAKYQFVWEPHNDYQKILAEQKHVDTSLYFVEKKEAYHQYFCLDFHIASGEKITMEKRNSLLLDFINTIQRFTFCIDVLKDELFPILEAKDTYSTTDVMPTLKSKSKSEHNEQKKIFS